MRANESVVTLRGHMDLVRKVQISPNGHLAVSVSSDKLIKVWDIRTQSCIRTLAPHNDSIFSVFVDWEN